MLLASALELGLVIWLSYAFGGIPQPACPCRARTRNKHRGCWRSRSLHSRAIPWMWWCAPNGGTSTEVRGRSKHSSVSWKAPGVAELDDPDIRRDTFLPAQCRDADSGLGQLVTQPTPKEYAHA